MITQNSPIGAPAQTHEPRPRKAPPRMALGVVIGIVLAIAFGAIQLVFGDLIGLFGTPEESGLNTSRFLVIDVLLGWVPAWGVMWAYVNRRQFSAPITTLFVCLAFGCVEAAVVFSKNNDPEVIGLTLLFFLPAALGLAAISGLVLGFAAEVGFRFISTRRPGRLYYLVPPLTFTVGAVLLQSRYIEYQPISTILLGALAHLVVTIIGCFLAWRFSKRYYPGG